MVSKNIQFCYIKSVLFRKWSISQKKDCNQQLSHSFRCSWIQRGHNGANPSEIQIAHISQIYIVQGYPKQSYTDRKPLKGFFVNSNLCNKNGNKKSFIYKNMNIELPYLSNKKSNFRRAFTTQRAYSAIPYNVKSKRLFSNSSE